MASDDKSLNEDIFAALVLTLGKLLELEDKQRGRSTTEDSSDRALKLISSERTRILSRHF